MVGTSNVRRKKGRGHVFCVFFFAKLSRSEVRVGLGSFFFVIDVTDEAVTSKKYFCVTPGEKKIIVYNKMNPLKENSPIVYRTKCESNTRDSRNSIPYTSIIFHYW